VRNGVGDQRAVQRVDAGEVREAGVGDQRRRPVPLPRNIQRVDAGEVREAGVGDPRAPHDVQHPDAAEVGEARVRELRAAAQVHLLHATQVHQIRVHKVAPPRHVGTPRVAEARAPRPQVARDDRVAVVPARVPHVRAEEGGHKAEGARLPRRQEAKDTLTYAVLAVGRLKDRQSLFSTAASQ
jgi:hypothetical protein